MVNRHRVIIVDDEPLARDELGAMLNSQHLDFDVVAAVENTAKAWELMQEDESIEGLFLDIDIQTESKRAGLDFALNLNRLLVKPWVVFISGYSEYAVEAFQSFPVNYLVKPVDQGSLASVLQWIRIHSEDRPKKTGRINIRHRRQDAHGEFVYITEWVNHDEILYIQKNAGVGTVKIGLIDGEVLDGVNSTLKEWEALGFFQIHRRNLVNLAHVRREMPRVGENTVYKVGFKNSPLELDIGPDYLLLFRVELRKL
ncbi:MAG: response regulator transcription factor [Methyloglobulus sp.]|nr:response regulator [Methyloglobulus sp.]